jgi:hypothetical protein
MLSTVLMTIHAFPFVEEDRGILYDEGTSTKNSA